MRVAVIGRTEILYQTAQLLHNRGYEIALILTSKEAPEYTKTSKDFHSLADCWEIPFLQTPRITEAADVIRKLPTIDIAVSLNYVNIIPQSVIDLFPLGILNAHGGDLPRYRGNACQAWAIINGEENVGLCIHRMVGNELDSGDIITRDYYSLNLNTKITEVYQWMSCRIPQLFLDALALLAQDPTYKLESPSKNPRDMLRCYPRKPEDGRIDWRKSNVEILRLINASNEPYAGAYCDLEGQKLIIWEANIASEENFLAVQGQVTAINDGIVEVACGTGKLQLRKVEFQGKIVAPDVIIGSLRQRLS